ncbi:MAG: hypothetical protein WBB67_02195 [bacterium]
MNKDELLKLAGFSDTFIKRLREFNDNIVEIPDNVFFPSATHLAVFDSNILVIDTLSTHIVSDMSVYFDRLSVKRKETL